MCINTSEANVLISELIGKLRDKETIPADFRDNLRRLGVFLTYEAANHFGRTSVKTETPLGEAEYETTSEEIVIVTILRAAMPMSEGVLEVIPEAKVGIIAAARGKMIQKDGKDFRIDCNYFNVPYLKNRIAIIVDPMLASGSTILFTLQELKNQEPLRIIILCAIATKYAIDRILENHPQAIIIAGDVDKELNEKGYIVPGLGDAGDRAFNT
ncbi:MAG: uracil phosphoribosyltransferase [Candidatus Heimdallarchaeaceae archaeon]